MSTIDVNNTLAQMNSATSQVQYENRKTGTTELSNDAFLQLMMQQLKYQDPLNPMDNQQFLAQQAQFTQISELQKINSAITSQNQIQQASTLIGKDVTLTDPNDSTKTIEGTVTEAKISTNGSSVVINGTAYSMDDIVSIKNSTSSASSASSKN